MMPGPRTAHACLLLLLAMVSEVLADGSVQGVIKGQRAPCSNEGETVRLQDERLEQDWSSCFRCICKNGFVECRKGAEECSLMDDCAVIMPREGCCARCKGCWYNGTEYLSHTEWNEDGRLLRCEAGVVTISRPECYAPCDRPKHQRHTHYNCPVNGLVENILRILGAWFSLIMFSFSVLKRIVCIGC